MPVIGMGKVRSIAIKVVLSAVMPTMMSCAGEDAAGPTSALSPGAAATAARYRLTVVEGTEWLSGAAINKLGKVAGTRGMCPSSCHPFLWTPAGGFKNLEGFSSPGFATDINNNSQVLVVDQTSGARSYVWARLTGIRELPSMGGDWTQGTVMNGYGDVAGQGSRLPPAGTSILPAFWPASGGVVDIAPPLWQGSGIATGVNNKRQVVGVLGIRRSTPLSGFPTPCGACGFIWDRERGLRRLPIPSRQLRPSAINDVGQIVGSIARDGESHAFRWQPGTTLVDLGTLGGRTSNASAINNLGVVVGSSLTDANDEFHPFVWEPQRGMVDLGIPVGAVSAEAADINSNGVITGWAMFPGPRAALVVWMPIL